VCRRLETIGARRRRHTLVSTRKRSTDSITAIKWHHSTATSRAHYFIARSSSLAVVVGSARPRRRPSRNLWSTSVYAFHAAFVLISVCAFVALVTATRISHDETSAPPCCALVATVLPLQCHHTGTVRRVRWSWRDLPASQVSPRDLLTRRQPVVVLVQSIQAPTGARWLRLARRASLLHEIRTAVVYGWRRADQLTCSFRCC
jgi:hypothetical protein